MVLVGKKFRDRLSLLRADVLHVLYRERRAKFLDGILESSSSSFSFSILSLRYSSGVFVSLRYGAVDDGAL